MVFEAECFKLLDQIKINNFTDYEDDSFVSIDKDMPLVKLQNYILESLIDKKIKSFCQ